MSPYIVAVPLNETSHAVTPGPVAPAVARTGSVDGFPLLRSPHAEPDAVRLPAHRAKKTPEIIVAFFKKLGKFQAVVEATASYEWFVRLLEPLAERIVLAHPKKLRVIAESTRKSDKIDARFLTLTEKIETVGASIHTRLNQLEAGLARVDERTKK